NTASVYTASSNVPTASANVATVSISQEIACAYIASQSSGSQIKFEDINQIDVDGIEEMDIKWNMALLSIRADKFWKKTVKKISIQGSDVAGFNKSKVECFNCYKMGHFQENAKLPETKTEEGETTTDRALAQVESRLVEYKEREVKNIEKIRTLEYYHESKKECIETLKKELETLKQEKEVVDGKLAGLLIASKDLDNLIEKSSSEEDQNRNPSVSENVASPITPKSFVKFVKASNSQSKSKTDEKETPKKPPVK
nr:hypothetical protein [Tanacetum cinerariifolium]